MQKPHPTLLSLALVAALASAGAAGGAVIAVGGGLLVDDVRSIDRPDGLAASIGVGMIVVGAGAIGYGLYRLATGEEVT